MMTQRMLRVFSMKPFHLNHCRSLLLLTLLLLQPVGCATAPFATKKDKQREEDATPGWEPRAVIKGATGLDRRARDIERNLGYN